MSLKVMPSTGWPGNAADRNALPLFARKNAVPRLAETGLVDDAGADILEQDVSQPAEGIAFVASSRCCNGSCPAAAKSGW